MIAAPAPRKVEPGIVGVHSVILRPVEDGIAARQHGAHAQDLSDTDAVDRRDAVIGTS